MHPRGDVCRCCKTHSVAILELGVLNLSLHSNSIGKFSDATCSILCFTLSDSLTKFSEFVDSWSTISSGEGNSHAFRCTNFTSICMAAEIGSVQIACVQFVECFADDEEESAGLIHAFPQSARSAKCSWKYSQPSHKSHAVPSGRSRNLDLSPVLMQSRPLLVCCDVHVVPLPNICVPARSGVGEALRLPQTVWHSGVSSCCCIWCMNGGGVGCFESSHFAWRTVDTGFLDGSVWTSDHLC